MGEAVGVGIHLNLLVLPLSFHPKVKKVARPTLTLILTAKVQTAEPVPHVVVV
jgi:hypothetical protein